MYQQCLLLGFRGRYTSADHGALLAIEQRLAERLRRMRGEAALAPDWLPPADQLDHRDPLWPRFRRGALATALLAALLEPAALLRKAEQEGDFTTRLALLEEAKTLPLGAVWQEHCARHNVTGDTSWIEEVKKYEASVLSKRG